MACVHTELQSMFALCPGDIVRELCGLRDRGSSSVLPDVGEAAVAELKRRKRVTRGVGANVDALQAEIGDRGASLNRETVVFSEVRKSETEFIHQVVANRIVVRDQQAAVLVVCLHVGQELVRCQSARAFTERKIFPTEPC